jgi:hypothetical protein
MKWLFLFLLTPLLLQAADTEATWSKPVNGLQARLFISPLKQGEDGHPHFVLFFPLKREDNMAGLMQVSYSPGTLALRVSDQDGKEWPRQELVAGNQLVFPWIPLVLPDDAFLSFHIGSSMRQGAGDRLGEYLEFNFWNQWRIPPPSSTIYYLTGTFTILAAPRGNPNGSRNWNGTLLLPKVEIPRNF